MRTLGGVLSKFSPRTAVLLGIFCAILALLILAVGVITQSPLYAPNGITTLNPQGIAVDCAANTLKVQVFNWPLLSNVEVVKLPNGPASEAMPVPPINGTATFDLISLGGNGTYTVGRQGFPHDPPLVTFAVDCPSPSPSPSPNPTPSTTPTPTSTPRHSPLPPNGGAYWGH